MSFNASRISLVHDLFVRTADENYITARWCAANELQTDFLWLAVHALEKYLKAVLLLNGRTSMKYAHDVVRLYTDVQQFAGDLLPGRLQKPESLNISFWRECSPAEFLDHLQKNGNADNRYLIYGYATHSEDLHKVDQMVFAVRRLICVLDDRLINQPGGPTVTNREILTRQPEYYPRLAMPLDTVIFAKADTPARIAALNLNLSFAPDGYEHVPMRGGSSSRNPVIIRGILDPLDSSNPQWAAEGIKVAEWFLAHVQVPKGKQNDPGVKEQIEAAIAAARQRHSLP